MSLQHLVLQAVSHRATFLRARQRWEAQIVRPAVTVSSAQEEAVACLAAAVFLVQVEVASSAAVLVAIFLVVLPLVKAEAASLAAAATFLAIHHRGVLAVYSAPHQQELEVVAFLVIQVLELAISLG